MPGFVAVIGSKAGRFFWGNVSFWWGESRHLPPSPGDLEHPADPGHPLTQGCRATLGTPGTWHLATATLLPPARNCWQGVNRPRGPLPPPASPSRPPPPGAAGVPLPPTLPPTRWAPLGSGWGQGGQAQPPGQPSRCPSPSRRGRGDQPTCARVRPAGSPPRERGGSVPGDAAPARQPQRANERPR